MALSRDQILSRGPIERETRKVYIPEWAGDVVVRQYSGEDADYMMELNSRREAAQGTQARKPNLRAHMLQRALVDEDGNYLFANSSGDLSYLAKLPMSVSNRIIVVLTELNGGEDLEKELDEGFDAALPADSSTS